MSDRNRTTSRARAATFVGPVLAVFALAVAAAGQTTPVRVATVETRTLQDHRKVTGELRAIGRSRVASSEAALVVELRVREGDAVRAGDVLAVLDDRRLKIEVDRVAAEEQVAATMVRVRGADLALAENDLEAQSDMESRGASNPKELADARSRAESARAWSANAESDLAVIAARRRLLEVRLDDTTIRAPFDGVVVAKLTEVGQWVSAGDEIADVLATGAYDAWIDVPQRYAAAVIGAKLPVQIRIDATGRALPPSVPTVIPIVDEIGRAFTCRVRVEDEAGQLAPGMSVTAWIPTGERAEHLTIPRDAILRNEAGAYVYVVRGQAGSTVAAPALVTILFDADDRVAVQSGALAPGDRVVVEGNERLFPMMPVAPEAAPPDAAAAGEAQGGAARGGSP